MQSLLFDCPPSEMDYPSIRCFLNRYKKIVMYSFDVLVGSEFWEDAVLRKEIEQSIVSGT